MKTLRLPTALALSLLLAACTTTSRTSVTAYDGEGNPIASSTSSSHTNHAVDAMAKAGKTVKDGAVAGYEWTRDKTVKGYTWVKDNMANGKDAEPVQDSAAVPNAQPSAQ